MIKLRSQLLPSLCVLLLSHVHAASERPNVVVILTDDQGWGDLSCHGNPVLATPALDRLSAESVEFTRFYVSPVCSLTRASLLTGRYPLRTGCFDTRFGHDTLGDDELTLADLLRSAGYRTALFGKWHQGRYMAYHPNERGFEEFFGFWQYGHVERYFHPDRMWHNKSRVACRGHITELITTAAINFITTVRAPFFCYVAYNVPHAPFQAPADLVQKYLANGLELREAQIYALIEQCDAEIGRLVRAVERCGRSDDTVIFFLSDNGGISRSYSAGLRGSKGTLFEGGIRSPFFARYPGKFTPGRKIESPGAVIDLVPTITELTGAALPSDRTIDGVSLLPALLGHTDSIPHRLLYHTWSRDTPQKDVAWSVQDEHFKAVNGQLFDLQQDPGESQDLAQKRPEVLARLRHEYERWFEDVTRGQLYERLPIQVGRVDENPIELQASWAKLVGADMTYAFDGYDWDSIDGWKAAGDRAIWQLQIIKAGRYELSIAYGCGPQHAGGTFSVLVNEGRLTGTTETLPARDVFATQTLGTLELEAGRAQLEVVAESLVDGQLMALNRLWLRRLD